MSGSQCKIEFVYYNKFKLANPWPPPHRCPGLTRFVRALSTGSLTLSPKPAGPQPSAACRVASQGACTSVDQVLQQNTHGKKAEVSC
jgi:hypothetical protein